jgi:hypothetical protein
LARSFSEPHAISAELDSQGRWWVARPPAAARADPLDRHGDWSHVDQRAEADANQPSINEGNDENVSNTLNRW